MRTKKSYVPVSTLHVSTLHDGDGRQSVAKPTSREGIWDGDKRYETRVVP
jgi:hypothetical protein